MKKNNLFDKGNLFKDYKGDKCMIVYNRRDEIKLSYICSSPYIEPWSKEDFLKEYNNARFLPILGPPITRLNVTEHLITFQLNLVGKNINNVGNTKITPIQYMLLKGYAIPLLRKVFKFNKNKAVSTFDWFYSVFGLDIKKG